MDDGQEFSIQRKSNTELVNPQARCKESVIGGLVTSLQNSLWYTASQGQA